ncbi:MAG: hypothetical protein ROO71_03735 [Balneola sp.]
MLWELDNEIEFDENLPDEDIDFLPGSIIGAIEDALEATKDFPKKRISWKRFCLDVEYSYQCITDKCYDQNEKKFTKEVYEEYLKALKALSHVHNRITIKSIS